MKDIGIEMADQESDPLKKYWGRMIFDYLIVLCEKAERSVSSFQGLTIVSFGLLKTLLLTRGLRKQ